MNTCGYFANIAPLNKAPSFSVAILMKNNSQLIFLVAGMTLGSMTLARAVDQKSSTPSPSPTPSASPAASVSPMASPEAWDAFGDMQRMQKDMDHLFQRALQEFGTNPDFLSRQAQPGFSSSIDVRDKGDHYEVHAILPGRNIDNVKVTAESDNLLRVIASESKQEKKNDKLGTMSLSEFGEYEQLVTLPGPARTKDMKVERKEHEIVVTIPKTKSK